MPFKGSWRGVERFGVLGVSRLGVGWGVFFWVQGKDAESSIWGSWLALQAHQGMRHWRRRRISKHKACIFRGLGTYLCTVSFRDVQDPPMWLRVWGHGLGPTFETRSGTRRASSDSLEQITS